MAAPDGHGPLYSILKVFYISVPFEKWEIQIYLPKFQKTYSFMIDVEELLEVNEKVRQAYLTEQNAILAREKR